MQLPCAALVKIARPAVTSEGTRFVGARGDRIVFTQALMSNQSGMTEAPVFAGSARKSLEPCRPWLGGLPAAVLMRSATEGGVLVAETSAPTPPEMPRTLPS